MMEEIAICNMTKQRERRKESKLRSYMKAPLQFLKKARDMYVRGMIHCSGHLSHVDAAMGCPTGQLCTLPRSFSLASAIRSSPSHDDFKDLIRAASIRTYGDRVHIKMPRSRSVGIARIDENYPCQFPHDDVLFLRPNIYPRSKSYASHTRGTGLL
ncbi:hypothetical protein VNO78_26531 [Psophocarpus tetragonolobus]|uniref:Uncharacterized protein n=1 Tax=Psophocarpus tetragonolobus TaxID=3891 RepID=A0AAN9X934_PSOTE